MPRREPEGATTLADGRKRPFDTIDGALQAWHADDTLHAEKLFEQGIDEYRRRERDAVDFALGSYGAFLAEQGRRDAAARVFEEATVADRSLRRCDSDDHASSVGSVAAPGIKASPLWLTRTRTQAPDSGRH
jgi:hypothetical protein